MEFLNRGGAVVNAESVIICVRGGGVAIVILIPEVLVKKCTHMLISFRRGDVAVIVDMLTKITSEIDILKFKSDENIEYIRNNTGRMLSRTILLSNLILPCNHKKHQQESNTHP